MKKFVIDLTKCVGCYNCQIACKDEHCGNDWSPIAKPQPETGQFWIRVDQHERGTLPKLKVAYIPVICQHCQDAPCQKACPIKGAIYRREDGLVIIDPVKCNGCRDCVGACPYAAIYFNRELNIAQKCSGCAHLLDRGWKQPRCADACPTDAIRLVEDVDFNGIKVQAEILHPEFKTRPNTVYINLPKKFISGTVYDPAKEDVVEGAVCTLTGDSRAFKSTTDGFGDFWFEGLETGQFALEIEHEGKVRVIDSIGTEKDVNLGDIPLY
jgi:tetrathionate reductase subunit B